MVLSGQAFQQGVFVQQCLQGLQRTFQRLLSPVRNSVSEAKLCFLLRQLKQGLGIPRSSNGLMAFPPLPTGRESTSLRSASPSISFGRALRLQPAPARSCFLPWRSICFPVSSSWVWSAGGGCAGILVRVFQDLVIFLLPPLLGLLNKFCGFGLGVRQLLFVFGAEGFCFRFFSSASFKLFSISAVRLSIILVMGPKRKCFRSRNRTRILTIFK